MSSLPAPAPRPLPRESGTARRGFDRFPLKLFVRQRGRQREDELRQIVDLGIGELVRRFTMIALGKIVSGQGRILYPEDREEG